MAATGKTPILLYGSTTATNTPSAGNLTNSSDGCEIAINVADKNLFFKDSTNVVNTVPIRQSSASSNGWLSSTDWSTFNGKAPAVTYTTNYIPYGQGTTTPAQSANFTWTGNDFTAIGTSSATLNAVLDVTSANTLIGKLKIWSSGYGSALKDYSAEMRTYSNGGIDACDWRFYTSNAAPSRETVRFASNGDINALLGNLVIGTSGKGIDFSATAGTGTSELLADYEEGTWTPNQGGGVTVVGTFGSYGTYTKVGRQVTVSIQMTGSTSIACSAASALCTNLPFTAMAVFTGSLVNASYANSTGCIVSGTGVYTQGAMSAASALYFCVTYSI